MRSSLHLAPRAFAVRPPPAFESTFARDVLGGLSHHQKSIPGTWLHDAAGAELFERITQVPAYYPARTEMLILRSCAREIGALAGPGAGVVQLGSGAGDKTALLLAALDAPASCVAIDVSASGLEASVRTLQARFPALPVHPLVGEFTDLTAWPGPTDSAARRVVFIAGSTIGNLAPDALVDLMRRLARLAGTGGLLVWGADATQDPSMLLAAYDDPSGVTAAFNKNLLVRMNRELRADFDVDTFRHAARFDTRQRRVELHLVSRCDQWVQVAGERFHFERGESIHTESAYKYGLLRIQSMASRAGWTQRQLWTDAHARFGVHVFECLG